MFAVPTKMGGGVSLPTQKMGGGDSLPTHKNGRQDTGICPGHAAQN